MSLDVEALQSSFALVAEREPTVAVRFYGHLFSRYPHFQPLFSRGAPEKQQQMLTEMLGSIVAHLEDADWLVQNLRALGARHADYGVTAEMYPAAASAWSSPCPRWRATTGPRAWPRPGVAHTAPSAA